MPRTPRIDFPGARHHVMNRGARKAPVLGTDRARQIFLEVLSELPERFATRVHGYALMPNHFHLMLSTRHGSLSPAMRHLGAAFTQRLNAQEGWDGPLFRGRFKNRVVGDSRYWMHLIAYLHLNPVPSLVTRPEEWPWSSQRAYQGLDPTPPWLCTEDLLDIFGSRAGLLRYISEHLEGRGTKPDGWDPQALWKPAVTGVVTTGLPALEGPRWVPAAAIEEVMRVTGRTEEELLVSRRGRRDNRARWLTAWWLERRAGLTQREIARHMDCLQPSVANMLLRLRGRTKGEAADGELVGWMEALAMGR